MMREGRWVLLVAVAAWLTASGGGGEATTTTSPTSSTSTAAGTRKVAPTTTAPATPTVPAATTAADALHPARPVNWAALWPARGSTATVRAESADGTLDGAVGIDYGLGWDGGV